MTREENIFLAKKLFVELIYNCAYIEGCNVTFPQTQTIIDGAVISNVSVDDIQTVLNLRDAWQYVLKNIDSKIDIEFICKINEFVSRNESLSWGTLRTGVVGISGTDWQPNAPNEQEVKNQLEKISNIVDPIEKSIEYFCYSVGNQLFWDGNKRTSTIISSKILIESANGVLTIDKKHAEEFNVSLLKFYDTGDKEDLSLCLKKCIKTMERVKEKIQ